MYLAIVACVPVALSMLLLNLGCVRAEYYSRSFGKVNSYKDSVSEKDLLNFLEDVYANEKIKSFPYQDESVRNDRGGEKPQKSSILDDIRYVLDSKSKNGWNDEDFYDLLDFLDSDNSNDLYDYEPWIGSQETSSLDNEGERTLLAAELLEDMLENAKAEEGLKSNDLDLEDYFEEEMKKQSEKEDDEKSEKETEEASSKQDENIDANLLDGSLKTSDGKKQRGQKDVDIQEDTTAQSEEDTAAINEKDDEEVKKVFAVDQNDVDELRSLLTQLADSEKSQNSAPTADTEHKSDSKMEDDSGSRNNATDVKIKIEFPGVSVSQDDTYLCTSVKISDYTNSSEKAIQIVEYIPHAKQTVAHHMLLYGCEYPEMKTPGAVWNCGGPMENEEKGSDGFPKGMICGIYGKKTILWAWAKDAPAFKLPKDVAFKIGDGTRVHYLVLQVHYKNAFLKGEKKDHSGVVVVTSPKPRPRLAGVYVLGSAEGTVPPHSSANFDIYCKYERSFPVHPFAFRTHTHALGVKVLGFRIRDGVWTLIGAKNPQLPEAFYPTPNKNMTIRHDDWLAARCKMKSFRNYPTGIGFRHTDEMCNFYFMFWVDAKYEEQMDHWSKGCFNGFPGTHWSSLPGYYT